MQVINTVWRILRNGEEIKLCCFKQYEECISECFITPEEEYALLQKANVTVVKELS